MDSRAITDQYLTAGRDYLAALKALDLNPEGLFWAVEEDTGQPLLILVTSLYDYAGPYLISQLLLQAYNSSATPKEISPFIVDIHSPNDAFIRSLKEIKNDVKIKTIDGKIEDFFLDNEVRGHNLIMHRDWFYQFAIPKKIKPVPLARRLARFEQKVKNLKAA